MGEVPDLIGKLRIEQQRDLLNPNGCLNAMREAQSPYPCCHNCPCALRDELIQQHDLHKAAVQAAYERCAEIAENRHLQWDELSLLCDEPGQEIAAAIRQAKEDV